MTFIRTIHATCGCKGGFCQAFKSVLWHFKMKVLLTIITTLSLLTCSAQGKRVIIDTLGVDSISQVFYKNGQLFFQVPYKDGKQNGWYEQYHENGKVWEKQLRINGKVVDGYNVAFHDNGRIYQKGYYKNGHEVGKWYSFTSDGKPFKIYFYNRTGKLIKLKVWSEEKQKWTKSGLY